MYQNVYGHGGGQNGQFVPGLMPAGVVYTMGYQPGAMYGQSMPGTLFGQMSVPSLIPAYGQFPLPIFPGQAYGYPQAPGPPQAHFGGHQPPPPPDRFQQHEQGGGGGDRRRRHFTEAPVGQAADNKRQAVSGRSHDGPARSSRDDDVGWRRYDDTAPGPQSGSRRQERDAEERPGDAQQSKDGQQQQQRQPAQPPPPPRQQQQQEQYSSRWGAPSDIGQRQQQQQQQQQAQRDQSAMSTGSGQEAAGGQSDGRGVPAGASGAGANRGTAPAAGVGAAAQGGSGGGGAGSQPPPQRRVYTVLGRNIRDMVEQLTPSAKEVRDKDEVLQIVRQAAQDAFPECQGILRVEPFGSYMCGLGTKSSDIDVVLVGLAEPSPSLGFYSKGERPRVARLLDRLTPHLRSRLRVAKLIAVRHARVPILKITTAGGVSVDISIAGMSGPNAATYIRQQVSSFPALRPLVLVLKSYMRELDLGEVAKGGLSSYGLTYMVMAHLMEETRRGSDPGNLAALLHTLLRRYGRNFDMSSMAVSVLHGGLVPRAQVYCGNADHYDRIVTIDPLTGRNITEGTFRSNEVIDAFARADAYLTAWTMRRDEDVPEDMDILAPLVSAVPDEDEDEQEYVREYAPPAHGAQLGKRGRSAELNQ